MPTLGPCRVLEGVPRWVPVAEGICQQPCWVPGAVLGAGRLRRLPGGCAGCQGIVLGARGWGLCPGLCGVPGALLGAAPGAMLGAVPGTARP